MNLFKTLTILILGLVAIAAIYFSAEKLIRYFAIDSCIKSAQVKSQRDSSELTEPDRFWYDFCMSEKGLK